MPHSKVLNLDTKTLRHTLGEQYAENPDKFMERIRGQQVMVYVMTGGGFIGRSHAEQPKSAYIDDRVSKRPYSRKAISNATTVLILMAEIAGLDPNNLPAMIDIHNSGVF